VYLLALNGIGMNSSLVQLGAQGFDRVLIFDVDLLFCEMYQDASHMYVPNAFQEMMGIGVSVNLSNIVANQLPILLPENVQVLTIEILQGGWLAGWWWKRGVVREAGPPFRLCLAVLSIAMLTGCSMRGWLHQNDALGNKYFLKLGPLFHAFAPEQFSRLEVCQEIEEEVCVWARFAMFEFSGGNNNPPIVNDLQFRIVLWACFMTGAASGLCHLSLDQAAVYQNEAWQVHFNANAPQGPNIPTFFNWCNVHERSHTVNFVARFFLDTLLAAFWGG